MVVDTDLTRASQDSYGGKQLLMITFALSKKRGRRPNRIILKLPAEY